MGVFPRASSCCHTSAQPSLPVSSAALWGTVLRTEPPDVMLCCGRKHSLHLQLQRLTPRPGLTEFPRLALGSQVPLSHDPSC